MDERRSCNSDMHETVVKWCVSLVLEAEIMCLLNFSIRNRMAMFLNMLFLK